METTYTMIGSDGQQYGPVALAQIKNWISEGRIGPETKVLRNDTQSWLAAAQYVELGLSQAPVAPPPPIQGSPVASGNPLLERRARAGAGWFYAIAVLSVVNSVMAMSSSGTMFIAGLAVARQFFYLAAAMGSAGMTVAFVLSMLAAGLFAVFGFFAGKRHGWSYIAGMLLYGLDALLYVFDGFWLGFAFHVFVLFRLFRGWQATRQLAEADARG
jgi:hypothetical protein